MKNIDRVKPSFHCHNQRGFLQLLTDANDFKEKVLLEKFSFRVILEVFHDASVS